MLEDVQNAVKPPFKVSFGSSGYGDYNEEDLKRRQLNTDYSPGTTEI
jgi:hypothetical protein